MAFVIDEELVEIIRVRAKQMNPGFSAHFYDPRTGEYIGILRDRMRGAHSWKLELRSGDGL